MEETLNNNSEFGMCSSSMDCLSDCLPMALCLLLACDSDDHDDDEPKNRLYCNLNRHKAFC